MRFSPPVESVVASVEKQTVTITVGEEGGDFDEEKCFGKMQKWGKAAGKKVERSG